MLTTTYEIVQAVPVTLSDVIFIANKTPKHITYQTVLGALLDYGDRHSGNLPEVTHEYLTKLINKVAVLPIHKTSAYVQRYADALSSIVDDTSKNVLSESNIEDVEVTSLEDLDAKYNGRVTIAASDLTTYFAGLAEGKDKGLVINTTYFIEDTSFIYLPSKEVAHRSSLLINALSDLPLQSPDMVFVQVYAVNKLLLGGYEDDNFIALIDKSFFQMIQDGYIMSVVLKDVRSLFDKSYDDMLDNFFS